MSKFTRTNKRRICFVHMPKCGGTSLIYALRNPLLHWDTIRFDSKGATKHAKKNNLDIDEHRESKLRELLKKSRYKYVLGHYRCSQEIIRDFSENWDFITVLRNPVDRWFSHYFFNRYKTKKHYKTDLSIEDYIESESGQKIGAMYVRFLTSNPDFRSKEAVTEAIENLNLFTVVGALESKDKFVQRFVDTFDRPIDIKHKNKNPASSQKKEEIITEEIRERVVEICKPDMEVYQYAVDHLI